MTSAERRSFIKAWWLVPQAALSVRFRGLRRSLLWLSQRYPPGVLPPEGERISLAKDTAAGLRKAIRVNPIPGKCLSQSLALWALLRAQGLETGLRIGVAKQDPLNAFNPDNFRAHAWVEYQGSVLNDSAEVVRRFAPHSPEITRLYLP